MVVKSTIIKDTLDRAKMMGKEAKAEASTSNSYQFTIFYVSLESLT
jgi:hypothetical protein